MAKGTISKEHYKGNKDAEASAPDLEETAQAA